MLAPAAPSLLLAEATGIEVTEAPAVPQPPAVPVESGARQRRLHPAWYVAGLGIILIALAVAAADRVTRPLPRVVRVDRLTSDGLSKDTLSLLPHGAHLWFRRPYRQVRLTLDRESQEESSPFDGFTLIDISPDGAEAVAVRLDDRGAEDALWLVELRTGRSRRLGMVKSNVYAEFSHDGRSIAYVHERSLYVTDRHGASNRHLHTFAAFPQVVRWAPDDSFLRLTLTFRSNRGDRAELWDIKPNGTGLREVLADWAAPAARGYGFGDFLPTGEYVFSAVTDRGPNVWLLRDRRRLLGGRSRELTQLTSEPIELIAPVWSADGQRIFAIGTGPPSLVKHEDSRDEFVPYLGGIPAFSLDLSRDGTWIAYVTVPEFALWRARADGSDPRKLTDASFHVSGAAISPDGRWIAIRAQTGEAQAKLYLVAAEGGPPKPLVAQDVAQGVPSWSPDGRWLAFGDVPETYGFATGSEKIHLYDLQTHQVLDVPGSEGLWTSRWSPDGRYIAAQTIADRSLMLYDVAEKRWRPLGLVHVEAPRWSRDSRFIYCDPEGPETRFRRVRVPDGAVDLTIDLTDRAVVHGAGIADDGSPLFLFRPIDIYAITLDRR
jgi:Tol biopolymer transport system component